MKLSEQEKNAAQADLDRLTGELVRLYQLREQLKLAINDGSGESALRSRNELLPTPAELPPLRLVRGTLQTEPERDPAQRAALRAQIQILHGGLS